jgi:hypothetical protein
MRENERAGTSVPDNYELVVEAEDAGVLGGALWWAWGRDFLTSCPHYYWLLSEDQGLQWSGQ